MADYLDTPNDASSPPPAGDTEKAERYVNHVTDLIQRERVLVVKTNLNKFDLASLVEHYRVDLEDHDVEVSHSHQPDTDRNFYTMLFNSIRQLQEGKSERVILAYIHLTEDQFKRFKDAADTVLERKRREAEEKRFAEAMSPIDQTIENLLTEADNTGNSNMQNLANESPSPAASSAAIDLPESLPEEPR